MLRRHFGLFLAATAVTASHQARAEELSHRLGVLIGTENDPERRAGVSAFKEQLVQLGWIPDKNLHFDIRFAGGKLEAARTFARELLALQPSVILAHNTISMQALKETATTIPIVFVSVFDPVISGFITNISRPGENVTGFTNHEFGMASKWVEFLKLSFPEMTEIALVYSPKTAPYADTFFEKMFRVAAEQLNLTPAKLSVNTENELRDSILRLSGKRTGLSVMADPFVTLNRKLIIDLVAENRIPTVYPWSYFVDDGGLMSYGPDQVDMFRRSADYISRILNGDKPGDLPVQGPARYKLSINLDTAKKLGVVLPEMLLTAANDIRER
jgi:putative tryptophan/tyrosine transport system substrate-binding protein